MTRKELAAEAESLGIQFSKSTSKATLQYYIDSHKNFIKLVEQMSKRPRRGLHGELLRN